MTKGERMVQRYARCIQRGEEDGHRPRRAILKRIKVLGQEKHTSRGSKLMNLIDCI
jgi:hypothetical protein